MIQEKYNKRIYDEASEDTLQDLSHLRTNVLEPVNIEENSSVLILNGSCRAIEEWLGQEKGCKVTVADTDAFTQAFDYVISLGQLTIAPKKIKSLLKDGGTAAIAGSTKDQSLRLLKELINEAGFASVENYFALPDYMFTTEIYLEGYKGDAADFLIVAK